MKPKAATEPDRAAPMNLFADLPAGRLAAERCEPLLSSEAVRLERIVSTGHVTPEGHWYDQENHEWVLVLQGRARLRFDDDPTPMTLGPGDHVVIAARRRHRVEWTDPELPTVWLALHYPESSPSPTETGRGRR